MTVRSAWALAGALALLAATAPAAGAATQDVSIQFAAFGPAQVDALPGDTIAWDNVSPRAHTVTADLGAFGSAELAPGAAFSWTAAGAGLFAYHCQLHPGMTGEVDVRHVTLDPLPTAVLAPGTEVQLTGRSDDPSHAVAIERDGVRVATAVPSSAGHWSVTIRARERGNYRALTPAGTSETRRLLVSRRRVRLRATNTGVAVRVTPSDPYGPVLLQARLRERFGWWPLARKRLDYLSEARFRVRRGGRVRAVLVDRDGWTPLAISRVVVLRRHAASPGGAG